MISNYSDIENSLKELENEIEKKFNIYHYTLKKYYSDENEKYKYLLNEIELLNEKLKQYNIPLYKKIYSKLLKLFKNE